MTIRIGSDGRFSIDGLSETGVVRNTQKSGFRGHWSMTGWILSCRCIDKAFKDQDAGWVNKRSVVKYLQRLDLDIELDQDTMQQINQLNKKSSTQVVQDLFNKAKLARAGIQVPNPAEPTAVIKLKNDKTYPAFRVRIFNKKFILLLKQDPGNRDFYEMLSQQEKVVLISSHQVHPDHNMSYTGFSKTLTVKQGVIVKLNGNDYRVLEINQKKIYDFILNGFTIDAEGLKSAHNLISVNKAKTIVLNADYEEGLLFAVMMGVFQVLEDGITLKDITISKIQELVTEKVEGQLGVKGLDIRSQLAKVGYDTDEKLQEAIQQALNLGENR